MKFGTETSVGNSEGELNSGWTDLYCIFLTEELSSIKRYEIIMTLVIDEEYKISVYSFCSVIKWRIKTSIIVLSILQSLLNHTLLGPKVISPCNCSRVSKHFYMFAFHVSTTLRKIKKIKMTPFYFYFMTVTFITKQRKSPCAYTKTIIL